MTEDKMVGWHHQLNGGEFEQTQGDSEEQGSLECCRSWGCKESYTNEQLNNSNILNEKEIAYIFEKGKFLKMNSSFKHLITWK